MRTFVTPNPVYVGHHPGTLLARTLAAHHMTSAEAACRLDVTPKHICEVIRGRARITVAFAIRLEYVFGRVAWDWLDLQWRHDLAKARDALRAEGV